MSSVTQARRADTPATKKFNKRICLRSLQPLPSSQASLSIEIDNGTLIITDAEHRLLHTLTAATAATSPEIGYSFSSVTSSCAAGTKRHSMSSGGNRHSNVGRVSWRQPVGQVASFSSHWCGGNAKPMYRLNLHPPIHTVQWRRACANEPLQVLDHRTQPSSPHHSNRLSSQPGRQCAASGAALGELTMLSGGCRVLSPVAG